LKQKINSLLATLKTVDAFGLKYAADYPVASLGGQQFVLVHTTVGLAADFIAQLNADITAFETVITAKGTAADAQAGATGGLADAAHQAAVALHVLNTVVKNTCKNNPAKLAEWATASHVEKHTPVPRAKPAVAPAK
jgi:hypothetical protein